MPVADHRRQHGHRHGAAEDRLRLCEQPHRRHGRPLQALLRRTALQLNGAGKELADKLGTFRRETALKVGDFPTFKPVEPSVHCSASLHSPSIPLSLTSLPNPPTVTLNYDELRAIKQPFRRSDRQARSAMVTKLTNTSCWLCVIPLNPLQ